MFRLCSGMQQPPREWKHRHAKFWPVPNWSKSGEIVRNRNWSNFSYDSGLLAVGGQWTGSTCLPKATVLDRNIYRMLRAPKECARFLYERRGAALQTPPWPGSLPHARANVSQIGYDATLG